MERFRRDKNYEYIDRYFRPAIGLKSSNEFSNPVERKKLSDGSVLSLCFGVSSLEFPGTITNVLRIDRSGNGVGELFLARPESAMISEAGYRTIMGLIDSKEDFDRLSKKMQPIAGALFELLRKTAADKLDAVQSAPVKA